MKEDISELIGEIGLCRNQLAKIEDIYLQKAAGPAQSDKSLEKAVLLADIFVNYYTCLETVFFRISQFFENALPKNRWHAELLGKMLLRIPDVREPVIGVETFALLDELRRFRHFKRYYFSMDYDWDRLEFLRKKFDSLLELIPRELNRFVAFLNRLNSA